MSHCEANYTHCAGPMCDECDMFSFLAEWKGDDVTAYEAVDAFMTHIIIMWGFDEAHIAFDQIVRKFQRIRELNKEAVH